MSDNLEIEIMFKNFTILFVVSILKKTMIKLKQIHTAREDEIDGGEFEEDFEIVPISKDVMNTLFKYCGTDINIEVVICMNEFDIGTVTNTMPCNNVLHYRNHVTILVPCIGIHHYD